MTSSHVAGEPVEHLARALRNITTHPGRDGSVKIHAHLDQSDAAPLLRAIMRVEAELLLVEAAQIGDDGTLDERAPEERRAEAFVLLAVRVRDACAA